MAVIIENMKIPKGCKCCELAYVTYYEDNYDGQAVLYCSYTGDCVDGFYTERANNCPLRESIQKPHGEWIKFTLEGGFLSSYKCSKCGFFGNQLWNFCPSCGSPMNEKAFRKYNGWEEGDTE